MFKVGVGQDSHRFLSEDSTKPCVMGGLIFDDVPGFKANSDGDVIFHAICNAISSITGILILGDIADELYFKHGITDSSIFLQEALKTLGSHKIVHVALSLEGSRPYFKAKIPKLRENIAKALNIDISAVGITATTGEGLTDFGCGDGLQCFVILTVVAG